MKTLTGFAALCTAFSLCLVVGCGGGGDYQDYGTAEEGEKQEPAHGHAHDHEHAEGPHGGHVIELGDHEYHGEIVFAREDAKLTVYILGRELTESHPIEAADVKLNLTLDSKPVSLTLVAAPVEDDPEGKSSRFELAGDEQVQAHVKDAEDLHGRLTVTIDGTGYSGEITHDHGHDEHGHDEHAHDEDHAHDDKDEKKAE